VPSISKALHFALVPLQVLPGPLRSVLDVFNTTSVGDALMNPTEWAPVYHDCHNIAQRALDKPEIEWAGLFET